MIPQTDPISMLHGRQHEVCGDTGSEHTSNQGRCEEKKTRAGRETRLQKPCFLQSPIGNLRKNDERDDRHRDRPPEEPFTARIKHLYGGTLIVRRHRGYNGLTVRKETEDQQDERDSGRNHSP